MRVVFFVHSILSDWNHGNAHFLRGLCDELARRGHDVRIFEPREAWSMTNLLADAGPGALGAVERAYPGLTARTTRYVEAELDLGAALDGAALVIAHEWNDHGLIARLGAARRAGGRFALLFHDTHHRSVTEPQAMARYDLAGYDGVLAFGQVIRDLYLARGWARRAFVFHEAADVRRFRPVDGVPLEGDLVWIGNWGDDERGAELREHVIQPARALGLRALVHGVRYPAEARRLLAAAGLRYRGWLPSHEVPRAFAAHRVTVHVPRRPYAERLPGIPTIRVFEALACGIPLVSAPWSDREELFTAGDFLIGASGAQTTEHLRALLADAALAEEVAARGRRSVLARHTCTHRAVELERIAAEVRA